MGLGARCEKLGEMPGTEAFDVISMADVLEHVPFPAELLRQAHQRMMPGGVLFLSCPSADSVAWNALGAHNPYWWEIEHFHNFSRENLFGVLREAGFDPFHCTVSQRYRLGMEVVATRKS
jgi:SAM-dependent methyltransferase